MNNQFVDLRRRWNGRVVRSELFTDGLNDLNRHDAVVVEDDNVRIAWTSRRDQSLFVDRRDLIIIGLESTKRGHVFSTPVGPDCDRLQHKRLSAFAGDDFFGRHIQTDEFRRLCTNRLCSGCDPAAQHLVLPGTFLESSSPFMRDDLQRLLQHQAVGNSSSVNAGFLTERQCFVIGFEVVSKQRQSQSAAPLERTMAGTSVATEFP